MKVISKLATVIAAGVVIVILMLASLACAQPAVNAPTTPPIQFDNIPLTIAIQALAREADINYLIDPRVIRWWQRSLADGGADQTPIENFRVTNMTPAEALKQMLQEHHLVLLKDPQTGVAKITYPNQTIQTLDPDLYSIKANQSSNSLPIQFTGVPLDIGLQALAREAGINYLVDPMVGYGKQDKDGMIQQPPTLTFQWSHVSPAHGFYALCENYGFIMERDPNSNIVFLRTPNHPITPFSDNNFFAGDTNNLTTETNTIPIQAEDVPLNVIIHALAKEANVAAELDTSDDNLSLQTVSFRFSNVSPKQVLAALCEDYNLVLTFDPKTGNIQIGPADSHSSGVPLVPINNKG